MGDRQKGLESPHSCTASRMEEITELRYLSLSLSFLIHSIIRIIYLTLKGFSHVIFEPKLAFPRTAELEFMKLDRNPSLCGI